MAHIYFQEYIIRKEGRVSYSVYARANALRIIKFVYVRKSPYIVFVTLSLSGCRVNNTYTDAAG